MTRSPSRAFCFTQSAASSRLLTSTEPGICAASFALVMVGSLGSREPNDPTITSAKLAAQIPGSVLVNSLQEAADWVKQNAQPGDLVITLGCGDIYKASKMMVEKDQ